jgi:hypothetical protein
VIVVIFLFLLDWRATIAVLIPVSLIGTFAAIKLFDFSINSLALFGICGWDWWWTTQSSYWESTTPRRRRRLITPPRQRR